MNVTKILAYYTNLPSYTRPIYLYLDDGNVLALYWNTNLDKLEYKVYTEEKAPPKFNTDHECFELTYKEGKIEVSASELLELMETPKPKQLRLKKEIPDAMPALEHKPIKKTRQPRKITQGK